MTHVLVTGASGGIGAAISRALAARGAAVTLHYHGAHKAAEETLRSLEGGGHTLAQADLSDAASVERLWREVSASRRMDAVVNNAGVFPDHPPLGTEYADWIAAWERTLAINLKGPAHLSYCAARTMAGQGQGRIVNVSSRAAFRGEPGRRPMRRARPG
jgi:3-oxoacyl-[acyl-carrier protein] reductase